MCPASEPEDTPAPSRPETRWAKARRMVFPAVLLIGLLASVVVGIILAWHHHFWMAPLAVWGYSLAAFLLLMLVERGSG